MFESWKEAIKTLSIAIFGSIICWIGLVLLLSLDVILGL